MSSVIHMLRKCYIKWCVVPCWMDSWRNMS